MGFLQQSKPLISDSCGPPTFTTTVKQQLNEKSARKQENVLAIIVELNGVGRFGNRHYFNTGKRWFKINVHLYYPPFNKKSFIYEQ